MHTTDSLDKYANRLPGTTHVAFTPKVLVVDDRPQNILVLRTLLAGLDVVLLEARSGTEALEILLLEEVAVALIDVQMPEMDGFELADLIRGSARTADTPIIFVTAMEFTRDRISRGYDTGAVDFLFKPLNPHVLKRKVEYFIGVQRRKEQLAAMLRLREEFVAVVSHDLRNPLNSIMLSNSMLRGSADPSVLAAADRIEKGARRINGIIGDLLDLSRARLGDGIPIVPKPCSLDAVLKEVVAEFSSEARARIQIQSCGDLEGALDNARIAQLLSNLLGNALEHGEAASEVNVTLDGTEQAVLRVMVANRGFIEPAQQALLFEPFTQGSYPEPRKGLGLGLYIVREIARAHRGSVEVNSTPEHITCFTVQLPRGN